MRPPAGTLCSPGGDSDGTKYAQLLVATSPLIYDSRDPAHTGGFSCIGAARNQRPCSTCTAMAVAAAAEAAVACISRLDANTVRLSAQDLYFCSGAQQGGVQRLCDSGWTMKDAIASLVGIFSTKWIICSNLTVPSMARLGIYAVLIQALLS